jgi:RNA polymerase sigma-70 factor (ECF subfamily)
MPELTVEADQPDDPDDALVAAVAAGDRAAFRRLYDRHCGRVMAVALRIVGNEADAADVAAAVFADAWHAWSRPDDASGGRFAAATDLLLSARGLALRIVTAKGTRRTAAYDAGDDPTSGALACVRPEDREAVVLVVLDGFTPAEVAAAAGVPPATIAERLRRGLAHVAPHACVPSVVVGGGGSTETACGSGTVRSRDALGAWPNVGGAGTAPRPPGDGRP